MEEIHQLRQVTLAKLERLKELGVNPYAYEYE